MKKILIVLLLTLLTISAIPILAQDDGGRQKGQGKEGGPMGMSGKNAPQERKFFGVSMSAIKSLGLTQEQMAAAGELQKKLYENIRIIRSSILDKTNKLGDIKDQESKEAASIKNDIKKLEDSEKKIQASSLKDFRNLLTEIQQSSYDKELAAEKVKLLTALEQEYTKLATDLSFTSDQLKNFKQAFANFNGTREEYEAKFITLLTGEQKTKYNGVKNAKMKTLLERQYNMYANRLGFTDEQKQGLTKILNEFDGNTITSNAKFKNLLTDEQKTKFEELQVQGAPSGPNNKEGKGSRGPGGPGGPGGPEEN